MNFASAASAANTAMVSRNPGRPTVLVLASGRGERFTASGGRVHKLQALLGGKTVLQHTLASVMASGLPWHVESAGHPGMGDSIAAAVRATPEASGWLILPGDLPLVQASTLRAVADALMHQSDQGQPSNYTVVVPSFDGVRGHPVGFSNACRSALMDLNGNQGAAAIVKIQFSLNLVELLPVDDAGVITDIDTLDDLKRAELLLAQRI